MMKSVSSVYAKYRLKKLTTCAAALCLRGYCSPSKPTIRGQAAEMIRNCMLSTKQAILFDTFLTILNDTYQRSRKHDSINAHIKLPNS